MDGTQSYKHVPPDYPGKSAAQVYEQTCMGGCGAACGAFRPDGKPVALERVRELATLAGWHPVRHYGWLCPKCSQHTDVTYAKNDMSYREGL